MSFYAFGDLTTLKKRASTRVIHRKGICRHVIVEDKLSAELRHKHVAHWITRILNATLEFSNPLRRELRIIANILFGSDSTRNSCSAVGSELPTISASFASPYIRLFNPNSILCTHIPPTNAAHDRPPAD